MPVQDRYPDYIPDQRAFFDEKITEDWETYFDPAWDEARRFEVARLLACVRPAPRTILDIGCGCGFHDVALAESAGVERVDGFDYSRQSINKAEAHYPHPRVRRFVADLASFEAERPYDLVVSFQVIEHAPDAGAFLARAAALAVAGGTVAVVTPNWRRLDNRVRRLLGMPPAVLDPQHLREYAFADLDEYAARAGLVPGPRFGHTLYAHRPRWMAGLPVPLRLRLGALVPGLAHVIGATYVRK